MNSLTRYPSRLVPSVGGRFNRSVCWRVVGLALFLLTVAASQAALAQNCKKLTPAGVGLDDAPVINNCLERKGVAKLKAGTFLLASPIFFPRNRPETPVSGVRLIGKGAEQTKLVVQSACSQSFPLVDEETMPRQYQSPIQAVRSPAAILSGFELDVTNLREDCGYKSNYMITVSRSAGAQVTGVRVKGSPFGVSGYTGGGANGGGILVVNSEGSTVTDNEVRDVGFTFEIGNTSAGYAGISVASSGNSLVQNNRIERVAFGIVVSNGAPEHGYFGNSSGTRVIGNTVIGAANINCGNCSQGRGIKLQACGNGTEPPLEKLTVSNNEVTEFGGRQATIGGSGIDLECGVQYSTFENNRVVGASTAEFALQVRSSFFNLPQNPSHHNTFRFNTFISGRGQLYCGSRCVDVNFTHDGPDQIGIRRNGADKFTSNNLTSMRHETDRGCTDHSEAYFLYLNGKPFARQGEEILLTAIGVRPNSQVVFRFKRLADGVEVATHLSFSVNRNCIMNQEYFTVDANRFPPGEYRIYAEYKDGNSNANISGDDIGLLWVKKAKGN